MKNMFSAKKLLCTFTEPLWLLVAWGRCRSGQRITTRDNGVGTGGAMAWPSQRRSQSSCCLLSTVSCLPAFPLRSSFYYSKSCFLYPRAVPRHPFGKHPSEPTRILGSHQRCLNVARWQPVSQVPTSKADGLCCRPLTFHHHHYPPPDFQRV